MYYVLFKVDFFGRHLSLLNALLDSKLSRCTFVIHSGNMSVQLIRGCTPEFRLGFWTMGDNPFNRFDKNLGRCNYVAAVELEDLYLATAATEHRGVLFNP